MNERVKELRKALGLSGEKFGERLGITRSAISDIERGRNSLSEGNILSICREFNVNEEWLRNGNGEMFIETKSDNELFKWAGKVLGSKDMTFRKAFVNALSKLSEDDWEKVEKFTRSLIDTVDTQKKED